MEEKAESLLADAMRLGVSDIHLLPYEDHYELFFRVSTGLSKVAVYSIEKGERLISYFKFLCHFSAYFLVANIFATPYYIIICLFP